MGLLGKEKAKAASRANHAVEKAIDIRKIWAIMLKNWMVLKSDKIRLYPLFLFPIIMIVVFGFSAGNTPKHIPAAVVDYDNTALSHEVASSLGSIETFSVRYDVGTQDEGRKLLDRGEIKVLFVLPSGFSNNVEEGKAAYIDVMVDASDSAVASISKATAQAFASQVSAKATSKRLAAISQMASAAQSDVEASKNILLSSSSQAGEALDSTRNDAYFNWIRINFVHGKTASAINAIVQGMKNSLGFLIDQNEVADSFTPASVSKATLALLAVGDQQQSTLQQIASYQGIGAAQNAVVKMAGSINADYQKLAAQLSAQRASSAVSVRFLESAEKSLSGISEEAKKANAAVEANFIEPYGYGRKGIDFLLPSIIALAIFQGATMSLGRAIAGEKKDGSLTRVFLTPTSNTTIIIGTQLFYLALEVIRSSFMILVAVLLFSVTISGSVIDIIAIIAIFAVSTTGIGMVISAATNNQEQYLALSMLVSLPVIFLSGVFFPIQTMPPVLQGVAQALPVTYAADALRGVMIKGFTLAQVWPDIAAMLAFGAFTTALSIIVFKRELA